MKKSAMTLLVIGLVIFLTTSVVMAGSNSPPKSVCYILDADGATLDGYKLAIATKKSGLSIKDSNGKVKFYNVQGAIAFNADYYNMTGSGYWDKSVDGRFEANVSGLYGSAHIINCLLLLDNSPVAICARTIVSSGSGSSFTYDLIEIDCRQETLD